jgi:hypothetical protein
LPFALLATLVFGPDLLRSELYISAILDRARREFVLAERCGYHSFGPRRDGFWVTGVLLGFVVGDVEGVGRERVRTMQLLRRAKAMRFIFCVKVNIGGLEMLYYIWSFWCPVE